MHKLQEAESFVSFFVSCLVLKTFNETFQNCFLFGFQTLQYFFLFFLAFHTISEKNVTTEENPIQDCEQISVNSLKKST